MGNIETDTDNRINYFVEQSRLRGMEDPVFIDNGMTKSLTWVSGRVTVQALFGSRLFVTVSTTACVVTILEYPTETDSQILDSISENLAG